MMQHLPGTSEIFGLTVLLAAGMVCLAAAAGGGDETKASSRSKADANAAAKADTDAQYRRVLDDLRTLRISPGAIRELAGDGWFRPYSGNPVVSTGRGDLWDAFALGSMTVCKAGDVYHMYYEAWGKRDYASLQIGHAVSLDGVHWAKDPADPVLRPGKKGQWDDAGTWDPFVLYEDGKFKLWYGGGKRVCDWGYAESADGRHFVKKGRLSHLGGVEDCHVVHDAKTGHYFMYYWNRAFERSGNALFRAESPDETHFDFAAAKKITIEGEKYPGFYKFSHVIQRDGLWHMFYANFERPRCATARTRYAVSTDGRHWKKANSDLLAGQDGEMLPLADDLYLMFYGPAGFFDGDDCDIRLAIYNGTLKDLASGKTAHAPAGPKRTGR